MSYKNYKIKNYVNIKNMCNKARLGKYAIPQFNINNLEWTKAILQVCEEMKSPVILGASEGAIKYMGGIDVVASMVTGLIKDLKISVPVALHLDHGTSLEMCIKCIHAGFSSVMFDGSARPIQENLKITSEVVKYAAKYDVSVEGEVGIVGGAEDHIIHEGVVYARIEDVVALSKTKIDVLAASYGSVHGVYHLKPNIGFKEIHEASTITKMPLVLHGGSGLSDEIIKKAIQNGESKINVNTENQIGFNNAIREYYKNNLDKIKTGYDPRKIINYGIENGMKPVLRDKIKLFGSDNKA